MKSTTNLYQFDSCQWLVRALFWIALLAIIFAWSIRPNSTLKSNLTPLIQVGILVLGISAIGLIRRKLDYFFGCLGTGMFGCLSNLLLLVGSFLALRFGWYGIITVLLSWAFISLLLGYVYKSQFLKLVSQQSWEHPFSPSTGWIIAVSRRFSDETVEQLYQSDVLPILREYGTVVECLFAENRTDSVDFWATRMNLILEIADVHVLMEHEPSYSILHEQGYSNFLRTRRRVKRAGNLVIQQILDPEHPVIKGFTRPTSIKISPTSNKQIRFSDLSSTIQLKPSGGDKLFQDKLRETTATILAAYKTRITEYDLRAMPPKLVSEVLATLEMSSIERNDMANILADISQAQEFIQESLNDIDEFEPFNIKLLLMRNRYEEFQLRLRASEKVVPTSYIATVRLIHELTIKEPIDLIVEALRSEFSTTSNFRPLVRLMYIVSFPAFAVYAFYIRLRFRKSISPASRA